MVTDGERAVLWEKAARLAVLAAAAIASGKAVGELRDDPAWRRRLEAALVEACAVAAADGVELDAARQWSIVDLLRQRLNAAVAAGSIGSVEAFSPEPGFVVQRSAAAAITAASDELGREALARVLAPLDLPGIGLMVTDGERVVLWEKARGFAVLAAAAILVSGKPVGELRDDPAWRRRLEAALVEACAVAAADGVELDAARR